MYRVRQNYTTKIFVGFFQIRNLKEFKRLILHIYLLILYSHNSLISIILHGFEVINITMLSSSDFHMLKNLRTKTHVARKSPSELAEKQLSWFHFERYVVYKFNPIGYR